MEQWRKSTESPRLWNDATRGANFFSAELPAHACFYPTPPTGGRELTRTPWPRTDLRPSESEFDSLDVGEGRENVAVLTLPLLDRLED